MCLTCGCKDAHLKMGTNVTYEDIRDIAVENDQTVDETLRILAETAALDRAGHFEEYARAWGTDRS
jgi:hypothetical protein